MNLTTRCTSCGTAFRVQPTQLSARGGKVRCGKCGSVFDGVKALVAEGAGGTEAAAVADNEPSPQLGLFEAPKKVTLNLTERCCGDQFFAKLTVPDGVKTGLDVAKVTLSFPNCPWGKVEPATYTIDVIPKEKK